jgi:hypothetical protein
VELSILISMAWLLSCLKLQLAAGYVPDPYRAL